MIKKSEMKKDYIAIINGVLDDKSGTINKPIRRKNGSVMEREISEEGQSAITHYTVLKELTLNHNQVSEQRISVVKLQLETGRTHQIRVHLTSMGTPILGDSLYGTSSSLIARQALHAYQLQFQHPITHSIVDISAPLPDDMNRVIERGSLS